MGLLDDLGLKEVIGELQGLKSDILDEFTGLKQDVVKSVGDISHEVKPAPSAKPNSAKKIDVIKPPATTPKTISSSKKQ